MNYRFKTEKELVECLGSNWRYRVTFGWNSQMDKLLGTEIPKELFEESMANKGTYKTFSISRDMVTSYDIEDCFTSCDLSQTTPVDEDVKEITKEVKKIVFPF